MPATLSVAMLTVRDLIRRRVLATLGLFATVMILLSFPLRNLTIGQWARLITDVGFGATDLCVTLLAILLGATLVSGDLERRTLYPLLAKPLSRSSFVAGKYLGLAAILSALVSIMTLGILLMLYLARQNNISETSLAQTAILIGVHAWVCAGIVVLLTCFTSTTMAGALGLALAVLGHTLDNLVYFAQKSESLEGRILLVVAKVLPNLERLNMKTLAAHQLALAWSDLGSRVAYGVSYAIATVALGAAVFSRRDLK